MKVIETSNSCKIFPDDLVVNDKLTPDVYTISFSEMSGWSLIKKKDFASGKEKMYGNAKAKIAKALKAYKLMERSLGILLSGPKGIGKTLFTVNLCNTMIKEGYPVIIVDTPIKGFTDFISSIQQEIVILFDEFDKNFKDDDDEGNNVQNKLLSFFDGLSGQKRMYLVTCNRDYDISDYMKGRPGRFHYHIKFDYPKEKEVTTYMKDKLKPEKHDMIPAVVRLSYQTNLNYDCLRAIAFELNMGSTMEEILEDLNIPFSSDRKLVGIQKNGTKVFLGELNDLDDYKNQSFNFWMPDKAKGGEHPIRIEINGKPDFDEKKRIFYYDDNKFKAKLRDDYDKEQYLLNPFERIIIENVPAIDNLATLL